MKYIFTLLLTAGMAATFAQDGTKPKGENKAGQPDIKLQTDDDKFVYSSMFRLIEYHKQSGFPIVEDIMFLAADDALNGKPSKMANEDMSALKRQLFKKWDGKNKPSQRNTTPADPARWRIEEKFAYDSVYSYITPLKKKEWFDKDIMLQSAKDAFVGKINRLENEPFIWVMRRLDVKQAVANNFKGNVLARKDWKAGVAYQKANKNKKGVTVKASGLQYRVIKEGTGDRPSVNDTVSITYKTTMISGMKKYDGRVIESSTKPKQVKLTELTQGLAEGLQLMKVGAKYKLVVPPELGISATFNTLIIEVELVDIVEKNQ